MGSLIMLSFGLCNHYSEDRLAILLQQSHHKNVFGYCYQLVVVIKLAWFKVITLNAPNVSSTILWRTLSITSLIETVEAV
jgi:hypothetical protein